MRPIENLSILEQLLFVIRGCLNNDHKCQKKIYERYYGYALKITFRYINQFDKAAEIVNDGFVKIFRSIHKFELPESEQLERVWLGWMKKIMINTAIDEFRRSRLKPETVSLPDYIRNMQDNHQCTDSNLLYKELIWQVKKLPHSYKLAFNMYVIDGFSHQEIADKLGISIGTSKSNLAKARILLKKFLERETSGVGTCS